MTQAPWYLNEQISFYFSIIASPWIDIYDFIKHKHVNAIIRNYLVWHAFSLWIFINRLSIRMLDIIVLKLYQDETGILMLHEKQRELFLFRC